MIPWRRKWQPTPTFLPRESPCTEEPGGLQSVGSQRVEHDWAINTHTHTHTHTHTTHKDALWDFLSGASGKESACQCRRRKGCWFDAWFGIIPWRSKWQTAPVFLPGKFHGKRSLAGYSPWGLKESDTVEQLSSCYDQPRQHIRKQRHYFANKSPSESKWWLFQ